MNLDNKTTFSSLALAYEIGLEKRNGRMEEDTAHAVLSVLASASGGSVSVEDVNLKSSVYARLRDEKVGIDPRAALTYANMALGAAQLEVFLLKVIGNGSAANLVNGIRTGTQAEFISAFFGTKPV